MSQPIHTPVPTTPPTTTVPAVDPEQVIPGCEDSYYRCVICAWRISLGWFGLIGLACSIVTLATQTLANFGGLSAYTQMVISIVSIAASASGVASQTLHQYAQKAIAEDQNLAAGIVSDYNTQHNLRSYSPSGPVSFHRMGPRAFGPRMV